MRSVKNEKIVSQIDSRENSRESMRALLRFAQTKVEGGVSGDFPLHEVARAKDFFHVWKRRKTFENNQMIGFVTTFAVLVFSFTSKIDFFLTAFLLIGVWGFYVVLELDKRKKVYIREMVGDMSHFTANDRVFYLDGLREELWKIEREDLKIVFALVTLTISILGAFIISYSGSDQQIKFLGMVLMMGASLVFFSNQIIKTKKVKV